VLGQIAEAANDPDAAAKHVGDLYSYGRRALDQSAKQPEAPVLRVERSDLDKRLADLTSEVESLRKQVEASTAQLKQLGEQIDKN
jgi:hypothetical protein